MTLMAADEKAVSIFSKQVPDSFLVHIATIFVHPRPVVHSYRVNQVYQ